MAQDWHRREVLAALGYAAASYLLDSRTSASDETTINRHSLIDLSAWRSLDAKIKDQWSRQIAYATEVAIRSDPTGSLLFLPFPYIGPTSAGSAYGYMFSWDTDFINRALLAHGNTDMVRNHIRNYCAMVDRFGYMPNANVNQLVTRSQTPLVADTLWRYFEATQDRELLAEAFPRLKRCYHDYWNAEHHRTPIGLATNRDLGDPALSQALAAEAETGLDWTPIFGGDPRRCVPLITNCALVRFANALALTAAALGASADARALREEAVVRSERIKQYCWSETLGFFVEYDYAAGRQLPYLSDCAYWALWAGVASEDQARKLKDNLSRLEYHHGLTATAQAYAVAHPAQQLEMCRLSPDGVIHTPPALSVGGTLPLQWMYPAGWAPSHLIVLEGLARYNFGADAKRIANKYLALVLKVYAETGHLWEKYNVVQGGIELPNARCGNVWMQGWTAAAVALLGRFIIEDLSLAPATLV